jgi:hypothetical protein
LVKDHPVPERTHGQLGQDPQIVTRVVPEIAMTTEDGIPERTVLVRKGTVIGTKTEGTFGMIDLVHVLPQGRTGVTGTTANATAIDDLVLAQEITRTSGDV